MEDTEVIYTRRLVVENSKKVLKSIPVIYKLMPDGVEVVSYGVEGDTSNESYGLRRLLGRKFASRRDLDIELNPQPGVHVVR